MNTDKNPNIIKIEESININEDGEKIKNRIIFIEDKNNPQKKYYEKNKERINEETKQKKNDRYKNDPEFRKNLIEKNKAYARKKIDEKKEKNKLLQTSI